ncbi:MAG: hypothetical protein JSU68_12660 [Phycisphaerales bacterium]|nr:MAG: hypothetical protein JSU68_12660 [Phycisphaerales bacterium]
MRKLSTILMAVAILFLVSGDVWADCGACPGEGKAAAKKTEGCTKGQHDAAKVLQAGDKPGCSKSCTKAAAGKSGCGESGTAHLKACAWKPDSCHSLAKLVPTMTYKVGDKETCCSKEAAKLAGENGKIEYLVMGETYANKAEATKAVTNLMNALTEELLTVHMVVDGESFECPKAAKQKADGTHSKVQYVALRRTFDTSESALAAIEKAKETLNDVDVTYVVDGKNMKCTKTAQKCAKEGKKVECHVGDKTTSCPVEADMLVAQAKLMALMKAIQAPEVEKSASL